MGVFAAAFAKRAAELALLSPAIPYVLGGRTRSGTDCSNLIRLILKELGGNDIQAGSNTMWKGHVIDRHYINDGGEKRYGGDLRPGDLLFMDYNDPPSMASGGTPGKMDHMGIYVGETPGALTPDGKPGTVVHASQSKGIVCFSEIPKGFIRWTHSARLKVLDYDGSRIEDPCQEAGGPSTEAETPVQAMPGPGEAMVHVSSGSLNLRKGPGRDYEAIKSLPKGAIVSILTFRTGTDGETWVQVRWDVRAGLCHEGWCSAQYLQLGGEG